MSSTFGLTVVRAVSRCCYLKTWQVNTCIKFICHRFLPNSMSAVPILCAFHDFGIPYLHKLTSHTSKTNNNSDNKNRVVNRNCLNQFLYFALFARVRCLGKFVRTKKKMNAEAKWFAIQAQWGGNNISYTNQIGYECKK